MSPLVEAREAARRLRVEARDTLAALRASREDVRDRLWWAKWRRTTDPSPALADEPSPEEVRLTHLLSMLDALWGPAEAAVAAAVAAEDRAIGVLHHGGSP